MRLSFAPAQMLVEPRHDLDEVAGPVAVVELVHEDLVPGIAAGAGRARQAEDIGRAGDARGRAGLDRRGADLGVAHHQEQGREAVHALLEQRLDRLRRHVAAGEAGAAGGDDHVDRRVGDPVFHLRADLLDVVGDDGARRNGVARLLDALGKRRAGLVVGELARVGHGQHRDFSGMNCAVCRCPGMAPVVPNLRGSA